MRSNNKTLERLVNHYEADPRSLHRKPEHGVTNTLYDRDLESMWTIAFSQLGLGPARLLGILGMLGPDRIPIKTFSENLISLFC